MRLLRVPKTGGCGTGADDDQVCGSRSMVNTDMPAVLPLTPDPKVIDEALKSLGPVGVRTHSAQGVLWAHRLLKPSWNPARI